MTWRELVFEICNKIPDEQFDEEAKMCVEGRHFDKITRVHQNTINWYEVDESGIVAKSYFENELIPEPIIKQFEFTLEWKTQYLLVH